MSRIEQEKQTVEQMIRLHCRKKEGNENLCPQCREVLEYAHARLLRCPFGEKKGTCRLCTIHCYKPEMRERMRENHEMGRAKNVVISSGSGYPAFVAGVY